MKQPKPRLVQEITDKLRDLILEHEPDEQIGSLNEVARLLGVGIVTVQQAARILEHEGFLSVRRGPGGGYYGVRPDEAALERALSAYLRVHGFGYREALEMMSLLDCEMMPAAAECDNEELRAAMRALIDRLDLCDQREERVSLEQDLRLQLLRFIRRPLVELVTRVTNHSYRTHGPALFSSPQDIQIWKEGRRRVLQAMLDGDSELVRFEAERHRQQVLLRLRRQACERQETTAPDETSSIQQS